MRNIGGTGGTDPRGLRHNCDAIRVSIGQTDTERRHVEAAWRRIQDTARALPAA